jgi:hypothetical protein
MKNKLFIVSHYKENTDWLDNFPYPYKVLESTCGHEATMLSYIYNNYDNLPDILGIIQAYPFDHAKEEVFYNLINNNEFTSLEYNGMVPNNGWENRTPEGYFLEINNSWYVSAHGKPCKYASLDDMIIKYFPEYNHLDWIRFSPGTEFLVPKENILYYSKDFWKELSEELTEYNMTESFMIERMMYYIFTNTYEERK